MIKTPQAPVQTVKLQALLAHAGIASRRKAEELISQGLVTVNGQPASIGQRVDPGRDHVLFKGQPVANQEHLVYFLVNKPTGVVSTVQDELHRPTVISLIPENQRTTRLYPVGRLDADSQGLMLLTNDGDLAYRLTHPSFKVDKTYYVRLDRPPSDKALEHLRRGVRLKEGKTAPAEVELLPERGDNWVSVTIHEGRNRQVRRMMERVGYEVVQLIRVSLGPFSLHMLGTSRFKQLTLAEIARFTQPLPG